MVCGVVRWCLCLSLSVCDVRCVSVSVSSVLLLLRPGGQDSQGYVVYDLAGVVSCVMARHIHRRATLCSERKCRNRRLRNDSQASRLCAEFQRCVPCTTSIKRQQATITTAVQPKGVPPVHLCAAAAAEFVRWALVLRLGCF